MSTTYLNVNSLNFAIFANPFLYIVNVTFLDVNKETTFLHLKMLNI